MIEIPESEWMGKKEYFDSMGYDWEQVEQILRLNRIYKSRINNIEDAHHLISRVKHWSDSRVNLKTMRRWDHVTHHDRFWNLLPAEQVLSVLSFNKQVLAPEIPKRIRDILQWGKPRLLYKQEAFK